MSIRNLEHLFRPTSIAVIGASNRARSVGQVVLANILAAGFAGPVYPVNPRHETVAGVPAFPTVAALPVAPDLAVICTPAPPIPDLIADLGRRGTRAAIVLTAGLDRPNGDGTTLIGKALAAARPTLLRILGPNCLGLVLPPLRVNATFAHAQALSGHLAFVSQSGALCTAALDVANRRGIGFSAFVSLGNSSDVDAADVLDYLAADSATRAILLYLEGIANARKFMSAARAAARNKPVVAIKAGRHGAGAAAAFSHTGALAGADEVYDAALRRAGVLRVYETRELFDAVETLARAAPIEGETLTIVTNGGGPGVMAADAVIAGGGRLAQLSAATVAALDGFLPGNWSRANPIDIIGDADGGRYEATVRAIGDQQGAILALHAPTAIASGSEAAVAVVRAVSGRKLATFACWLGGSSASEAVAVFGRAGIPCYDTPEDAVRAFLQLVQHRRNRLLLTEVPGAAPALPASARADAARILDACRQRGQRSLSEIEAKAVLAAYGIPSVPTRRASDADSAAAIAAEFTVPVALKILSPDISHKTDVGGVVLDLETPNSVRAAAIEMMLRVARLRPQARIEGFTVQPMARRPHATELIVGFASDPVFGPVVLFGHGGRAVEVVRDRAVALPPLNHSLARALVAETRVARLLAGFRDQPPADQNAIGDTLLKLAAIAIAHPEIAELDINPLWADADGVLALDARARLTEPGVAPTRPAIGPYPEDLAETLTLSSGGSVFVRPIRPEDEQSHAELFAALSPDDVRARFFGAVAHLSHEQLARYTQIDYDREIAFVAFADRHSARILGVARAVADPDNERAEFAVVVRSDCKRRGLGRALLAKIVRYAQARGVGVLSGVTRPDNKAMIGLARSLGFSTLAAPEGTVLELALRPRSPQA